MRFHSRNQLLHESFTFSALVQIHDCSLIHNCSSSEGMMNKALKGTVLTTVTKLIVDESDCVTNIKLLLCQTNKPFSL